MEELLNEAVAAGLSSFEGNVVIDLFMLASDNEEWLHADGLKEMMRCTLPLLVPSRLAPPLPLLLASLLV